MIQKLTLLVHSSLFKCTIIHIYFPEWSMKAREIYQDIYMYVCNASLKKRGRVAHIYTRKISDFTFSVLLSNTQIPVFSSKSSYIFLPPTFFLSCFIFMFQLIENQAFQEMKHSASMFHFWFQCFIFIYHTPFQKTHTEKNQTPMGAI